MDYDNIKTVGSVVTSTGQSPSNSYQWVEGVNNYYVCQGCGLYVLSGQWHVCQSAYQPVFQTVLQTPLQHPHECPVCEGKGRVQFDPEHPHAFVRSPTVEDWSCKPCSGSGVLWR